MELGLEAQEVEAVIGQFIAENDFYQTNWNGEECWAWDHNAVKGYRFFQYSYHMGILHIEAWLRNGKSGEMGLTGFGALSDKVLYLELINQLFARLTALLPEDSPLRQKMQGELEEGNKKVKIRTIVLVAVWVFILIFVSNSFLRHF